MGVIVFYDNTHLFYLLYKAGGKRYNGVRISKRTVRKVPSVLHRKRLIFYYGSQTTSVDPGVHPGHPC